MGSRLLLLLLTYGRHPSSISSTDCLYLSSLSRYLQSTICLLSSIFSLSIHLSLCLSIRQFFFFFSSSPRVISRLFFLLRYSLPSLLSLFFSHSFFPFSRSFFFCRIHFQEMCKLLSSVFRVNTEAYRLFKGELEGGDIEEIQRSLLSLGFSDVAEKIFKDWKRKRLLFLKQKEEEELLAKSQADYLLLSSAGGKHHKAGGATQKKDKKAAKNVRRTH